MTTTTTPSTPGTQTTPSTPKFSQLRVLVDDFAPSFRFYRDVLGLEPQAPEQESGPYACFKAADGGTDIALLSRAMMEAGLRATTEAAAAASASGVAGTSAAAGGAVLVLRVDDVDAAHGKAIGNGAENVAAPVDQPSWGMRVAHVRAPEGTLIEFCSY